MYVRSALSIMKAVQANNHEASTYTHTKTTYPPKCEHGTSDQIFSTCKRRTLAATSLHKPSSGEALATEPKMARVEIQVCGICRREKDGKQSKDIEWIAFSKCALCMGSLELCTVHLR